MDLRGRTVGSSNPNEVGNPAVLLKRLEDVPKRSVKPKGSQEPLLTVTANVNPPVGETKAQRSQRKINEAMENAKNNDASASELIKIYRKAVADAETPDSPDINHQVSTTSSNMVEQTITASQSSLEDGQIRETLPAISYTMVNRLETTDGNPFSKVVEPGVEEVRDSSNQSSAPGTTNNVMVEQVNPLLYPHSSKDKEYSYSYILVILGIQSQVIVIYMISSYYVDCPYFTMSFK